MRVFAALEMPHDVAGEIEEWWREAAAYIEPDDWRHVPSRNWHVTLAFYGDVPGNVVDELAEALAECARGGESGSSQGWRYSRELGRPVRKSAELSLKTGGFGAFPKLSKPRVLWAGVDDVDGSGALRKLARCCRQAGHATVRGHAAKEGPFKGHITLARANEHPDPVDPEAVAEMPPVPELTWQAGEIVLFQSILKPEGAQYRKLESFELGMTGFERKYR